jgi:ABC-type antimicrobial peptide transport system permease subunit
MRATIIIAMGLLVVGCSKKQAAPEAPGVLVVHQWWGHSDYVRKRARMLAKLGYTALALDLYGEGKHTDHPEDAMKFVNETVSNFIAPWADPELFRMPFMISNQTYAFAITVVLASGVASALLVRRKLDRLDLIGVLKTRE